MLCVPLSASAEFLRVHAHVAKVFAVASTPYDQFAKQLVRAAVDDRCTVESDAEVPASPRHIDLWSTPREAGPPPEHLGLLGRILSRPATMEFFHNTPSGEELRVCMNKHDEFRLHLSRRKSLPPSPGHWVFSAGRPADGIEGLGFRRTSERGIYRSPRLHYTRLVVVSELPVTHDTLLVRLFGAGATLKRAIAEVRSLEASAPESLLALDGLVALRLALPADAKQQTGDDQELMMNTQEIYENWRRKTFQQGIKQGERQLLMRQLRRRFGDAVDSEVERLVAAASFERIEIWGERVLSATTLAELLAD